MVSCYWLFFFNISNLVCEVLQITFHFVRNLRELHKLYEIEYERDLKNLFAIITSYRLSFYYYISNYIYPYI